MVLLSDANNSGGAATPLDTSAPVGNGTYDGELKVIRLSDRILFYSWDDTNTEWIVGEIEPIQGTGSPVGSVTPDFIGQTYLDTTPNTFYRAYGATSSDWKAISS